MRTTLRIDDDVLQAAKSLAAARGASLGKVISDLARKGLRPTLTFRYENDFPVFDAREDAPVFGLEVVQDALDDS